MQGAGGTAGHVLLFEDLGGEITVETKKGEICIKTGVKVVKIASFWVINRQISPRPPHPCIPGKKIISKGRGWNQTAVPLKMFRN